MPIPARCNPTRSSSAEEPLSRSAPDTLPLTLDQCPPSNPSLFDPAFTLLPPTPSNPIQTDKTPPLTSPLEAVNPLDIPLEPSLSLEDAALGCTVAMAMDVDLNGGSCGDVFHVEDWSRYLWSPESGFEHLDMQVPPVTGY